MKSFDEQAQSYRKLYQNIRLKNISIFLYFAKYLSFQAFANSTIQLHTPSLGGNCMTLGKAS